MENFSRSNLAKDLKCIVESYAKPNVIKSLGSTLTSNTPESYEAGIYHAYLEILTDLEQSNKKIWISCEHRYVQFNRKSVITFLNQKIKTAHYANRNGIPSSLFVNGKRKGLEEIITLVKAYPT